MFRSISSRPAVFRVLRSSLVPARPPRRARHHTFRCLPLEQLEERSVPSVVTFTVSSLADSGGGTLREAITMADQATASNSYVINIVTPGTITLESVLPDLSRNITITGLGASTSTVQRDSVRSSPFRIFTVDAGETVNISGLTIARGNAGNGSGGGLDNSGTLTVSNSVFSSDSASFGGGLANESGGTATVSGSSFTSNSASLRRRPRQRRDGDGERQHLHQQLRQLRRRRPRQRRDGDGERQHLHQQLRPSRAAASTTTGRRR